MCEPKARRPVGVADRFVLLTDARAEQGPKRIVARRNELESLVRLVKCRSLAIVRPVPRNSDFP